MTTKQRAEQLASSIADLEYDKSAFPREHDLLVEQIMKHSPLLELLEAVEALKGANEALENHNISHETNEARETAFAALAALRDKGVE